MAEKVQKKNTSDRIQIANLNRLNKTAALISSKNNWFYLAIILINLVSIFVAWLVESNGNGVATGVLSSLDYKYLYLLLISMIIIAILKLVPDYVYLYTKSKGRKFGSVFVGNVIREYYRTLTISAEATDSLYMEKLKSSKINENTAREMVNTSGVASRLSSVLYSFVVILLGTIFVFESTNVFLYIVAILGFVLNLLYVLVILYFDKFKAKYLLIIGGLCKFLYGIKLVKDYEKLYNTLVVKLMQYGTVFKNNKMYMFSQILCGVVIKFVTHLMIFFVVGALNLTSWEILISILFNCVVLDIVVGFIPTPKGTLVYELLFLMLFRTIFISGYVLYGMIAYRIIRYFAIQIVFGIGYLCGIRKQLKTINKQLADKINSNV